MRLAQERPGDGDPQVVKNPTNRFGARLQPEKELGGEATRDNGALCIHIRRSGRATAKRGGPLKQRLGFRRLEIVRAWRSDYVVVMNLRINAFTDKPLQEARHGAARALERRP